VAGFENVATCERGEDCSCQYAKVNYQGGVTKYIGILSKNAPPQGVCVGGDKDGQACIPDSKTKSTVDYSDANAAFDASVNEACGSGSACQPLQGTTYVRGTSGFCIQRDAAVTVGDKGRYQCLTWNPQPILAGSKDVYHYSPTAGYNPPLNSGEYYCVSPAFAGKQGIQVQSSYMKKPGLSDVGGWLYKQDCMNKEMKVGSIQSGYKCAGFKDHPYGSLPPEDDDVVCNDQSMSPVTNLSTADTACRIVDGTDLKQTTMATWCTSSKKKITTNKLFAFYSSKNGDQSVIDEIKNQTLDFWSTVYPESFDGNLSLKGVAKDVLNVALYPYSLAKDALDALNCFVLGCPIKIGTVEATLEKSYTYRSTLAIPTMTGFDDKTVRFIQTGEGKEKSYAEYFVPVDSPFIQAILKETSGVPGSNGELLESQLGYFRFHVPRPGVEDVDYLDEAAWSTTPKTFPDTFDGNNWFAYLVNGPPKHQLSIEEVDSSGPDVEDDYVRHFTFADKEVVNESDTDYAVPPNEDPSKSYGTLGCLMSPE
jgi:hypothetical protein